MDLYKIKNKGILLFFAAVAIVNFTSCQPEDSLTNNGLTPETIDASFEIAPVAGNSNKYMLTSQTKDVLRSGWDLGDGAGMYFGKMVETVFLPDAGSYSITHNVIGKGGIVNTATQTIVVAKSDLVAGNILKGGKLTDKTDWSQWTITSPSSNASLVFSSGSVSLTASGYAGNGFYQAVDVVAGKKYVIDMVTSSTTGCVNTWLEVYCGYATPIPNTDYSEGGKLRALSTWDGCAKEAFSGKISIVGCSAENNKGIFTATKTGKAYLVIRGGGDNMKAGIKIQNIEMRLSL